LYFGVICTVTYEIERRRRRRRRKTEWEKGIREVATLLQSFESRG